VRRLAVRPGPRERPVADQSFVERLDGARSRAQLGRAEAVLGSTGEAEQRTGAAEKTWNVVGERHGGRA